MTKWFSNKLKREKFHIKDIILLITFIQAIRKHPYFFYVDNMWSETISQLLLTRLYTMNRFQSDLNYLKGLLTHSFPQITGTTLLITKTK